MPSASRLTVRGLCAVGGSARVGPDWRSIPMSGVRRGNDRGGRSERRWWWPASELPLQQCNRVRREHRQRPDPGLLQQHRPERFGAVGSTPCTASETALDWAKVGPAGVSSLYHGFHRGKVSIPGTQHPAAMVRDTSAGCRFLRGDRERPLHLPWKRGGHLLSLPIRPRRRVSGTFNLPHHEEVVADPKVESVDADRLRDGHQGRPTDRVVLPGRH